MLRSPEAVPQHLNHMRNGFVPFPLADDFISSMDLNREREAEGFYCISDEDADSVEKMAVNKGRFRSAFGFLYHFFHTRHIGSVSCSFCTVTDQHGSSRNLAERRLHRDHVRPFVEYGIPFPRRSMEEVFQAGVKRRLSGKITDD